MRLLLDTCTFLWLITDAPQLSQRARILFSDRSNLVFLSAVSVWEMAVKCALGRLELPTPLSTYLPHQRDAHGIRSLSLTEEAAAHLPRLPALHRDPFDRMLICQALCDGMTILTPDVQISRYPARVDW